MKRLSGPWRENRSVKSSSGLKSRRPKATENSALRRFPGFQQLHRAGLGVSQWLHLTAANHPHNLSSANASKFSCPKPAAGDAVGRHLERTNPQGLLSFPTGMARIPGRRLWVLQKGRRNNFTFPRAFSQFDTVWWLWCAVSHPAWSPGRIFQQGSAQEDAVTFLQAAQEHLLHHQPETTLQVPPLHPFPKHFDAFWCAERKNKLKINAQFWIWCLHLLSCSSGHRFVCGWWDGVG